MQHPAVCQEGAVRTSTSVTVAVARDSLAKTPSKAGQRGVKDGEEKAEASELTRKLPKCQQLVLKYDATRLKTNLPTWLLSFE